MGEFDCKFSRNIAAASWSDCEMISQTFMLLQVLAETSFTPATMSHEHHVNKETRF